MTVIRQNEPITDFIIWSTGSLQTTYGDCVEITYDMLKKTYDNYIKLGRRLSLDVGHRVSDASLPLTERLSIATFDLQLTDTTLSAIDIIFNTPELEFKASTGQFGIYISPEFYGMRYDNTATRDLKQAIGFEIERCAITDNPASYNAKPIVKLEKKKPIILEKDNLMDEKLKEAISTLQTLLATLPTVINGLGAAAGMEPNMDPAKDIDKDAVQGVDIDEPSEASGTEAELAKEPSEASEAPAEAVKEPVEAAKEEVSDEPKKELEVKEELPEEKKLEAAPTSNVAEVNPNTTEVDDDKKILEYVKGKLGKDSNEIMATLMALESAADKSIELSKQLESSEQVKKDLEKKSEEELKEANVQLAIKSGKISPLAFGRIEEFKKLPVESQRIFLSKQTSLFDKVVQPSIKTTVETIKHSQAVSREVDCLPDSFLAKYKNK